MRADQYYGVDQQYFTTAIDYRVLEIGRRSAGHGGLLRTCSATVVRVIRDRAGRSVLVARFQRQSSRDGSATSTAGLDSTLDAYRVAGDPKTNLPRADSRRFRPRSPWQP
jgi:hypothetical protein